MTVTIPTPTIAAAKFKQAEHVSRTRAFGCPGQAGFLLLQSWPQKKQDFIPSEAGKIKAST